jgi:hypothetical protein
MLEDPQSSEVYQTLLNAGYTDLACAIREGHTIDKKSTYDLLVHVIALRLEHMTCGQASQPCLSCVGTARTVAFVMWAAQYRYMQHIKTYAGALEGDLVRDYHTTLLSVRDSTKLFGPTLREEPPLEIERPSKIGIIVSD